MGHLHDEIASQPECWRRAAALANTDDVQRFLPQLGERVAVVGCGTSLYMAQACAALREGAGHGETDAWPASEFPDGRTYDRVVALTRSGTTTEVRVLLRDLPTGVPSVVLVADGSAPVVHEASGAILLGFADEQAVVQTRFATSLLALWRAWLGEDLTPVIADARTALAVPLPPGAVEGRQFAFLGTGWTVGVANEAALKLREAARAWTEAYPAMEFRHGPVSVIDEQSVVWVFGAAPPGLLDEASGLGAVVVHGDLDPLAQLVLAQRVAVAVAEGRGLDPASPRNLTRSIVLQG